MAEEEGKEQAEASGGGKKKLIIILLVVILLLAGGGGAFFVMKGSGGGEEGEEGVEEEEEVEAEGIAVTPAVLPLETFIVNLQVKGSFLKTTVQLEFAEPELPPTVESDVPKIRDKIIKILSSRSAADILAPEGKEKLREDIRDGVNEALGAEDVTFVYFTEFIIQ